MRLLVLVLLAVSLPAASVFAICSVPRPAVPDVPRPRPGSGLTPPGSPDPSTPGTPTPGTPGTPPIGSPPGGSAPSGGAGGIGGSGSRGRGRRGPSYAGSWYLWWELNRENLLGLRATLRGREAVTDDGDPVAPYRERVREVLRSVAGNSEFDSVRAAALRALGRAGTDEDARTFLALLGGKATKPVVRGGAAIGLALLRSVKDDAIRTEIHTFAGKLCNGQIDLPRRDQELVWMALAIRARRDPALVPGLASRARRPVSGSSSAAALLLSLGLCREEMLGAELNRAVRFGTLGERRLHDVSRSHAATALAVSGDPAAVDTFVRVLTDSDVQAQTRRAATIGLGIVLREQELPEKTRKIAERILGRLLSGDRDPLVVGYAAVGLGFARRPAALEALVRMAGRSGGSVEAPYAALALGLAARNLPDADAKMVRRFLAKSYARCRDLELSCALGIAAGVGGAKEALPTLLKRVAQASTPLRVRGMAAQALGLLGQRTPEIERVLLKALDDGAPLVTENAAIALGLLGRRETAPLLVEKLKETRSKALQIHMVIALTHLGGTAAIQPLIGILETEKRKHRVLESAATVLGILVDDRENDPLFEVDASINPYGLTSASRELVLAY